tara:strand:- start:789 stop:1247 length:459 start_codon:yes stop_codon:yes gene_type:complete
MAQEREIRNPYYADSTKNLIVAEFVYPDGKSQTVSISNTPKDEKDNPDWKEVFNNFTHNEINVITKKKADEHHANQAIRIAEEKAKIDKDKNEALFAAKVDSFEIPEVKASKNRALKSKVRKATNMVEIFAYSAAIILEENAKEAAPVKAKA